MATQASTDALRGPGTGKIVAIGPRRKFWATYRRNRTQQVVAIGLMQASIVILGSHRNIYSRPGKPWVMLTDR